MPLCEAARRCFPRNTNTTRTKAPLLRAKRRAKWCQAPRFGAWHHCHLGGRPPRNIVRPDEPRYVFVGPGALMRHGAWVRGTTRARRAGGPREPGCGLRAARRRPPLPTRSAGPRPTAAPPPTACAHLAGSVHRIASQHELPVQPLAGARPRRRADGTGGSARAPLARPPSAPPDEDTTGMMRQLVAARTCRVRYSRPPFVCATRGARVKVRLEVGGLLPYSH